MPIKWKIWQENELAYLAPSGPKVFGSGILAVSLMVLLVIEFLFFLPALVVLPNNHFTASVLPAVLVDFTNEDRIKEHIPLLKANNLLAQAAQLKAEDMSSRGYFSHVGPSGEQPWVWLDKVGYDYIYAGENLAINFYDSRDINDAWMNSPKHRENIMKQEFKEVGIGATQGKYNGRDSVMVVQFFGSSPDSLTWADEQVNLESKKPKSTGSGLTIAAGQSLIQIRQALDSGSTFWQKIIVSPRNTINMFLGIFILIISLVIITLLFVRKGHRPIRLIGNGIALVFIASVLLSLNNYIAFKDSQIGKDESGSSFSKF